MQDLKLQRAIDAMNNNTEKFLVPRMLELLQEENQLQKIFYKKMKLCSYLKANNLICFSFVPNEVHRIRKLFNFMFGPSLSISYCDDLGYLIRNDCKLYFKVNNGG